MPEKRVHVWVQTFKDRPHLVLQWMDPDTGRRKSKSAETADPKQAQEKANDLASDLAHGRYQEKSKLSWAEFRKLFEDEYAAGLREKTREKYTVVLDVFEQTVNPARLRSINARTLSLFVKGMRERKKRGGVIGLAPWSIKNYLGALRKVLRWAHDQELLPSVPKFPQITVPIKKPQPVSAEAFERLLAKCPNELWRTYLLCAWYAGLRLSEARHLRWETSEEWPWIDFDGERIVLPAVFAKSNEDQWVPLHPTLREAIEALPRAEAEVFPFRNQRNGLRMTNQAISARVLLLARQAGVKLSMHKLRKGFGCRVARQLGKGNAPILHRLMRHSSMQVTMDFYANVDDAAAEAIKDLT